MHLNLDAVPYVFMGMSAGDADGLGDPAVKLGGVAPGTERQSGQDAAADVDVLVRDEFAQGGFEPCRPESGQRSIRIRGLVVGPPSPPATPGLPPPCGGRPVPGPRGAGSLGVGAVPEIVQERCLDTQAAEGRYGRLDDVGVAARVRMVDAGPDERVEE